MICSHCKRSGHDTNYCFALIGYPEWWGDRPCINRKNGGHGRGSQSSLQHGKDKTMICSHCKRSGHDANFCFALIRYPEWWGDRRHTDRKNGGRGRGSQSSLQHGKDKTMICSHCKRSGHDANSCFALIGYLEWWGDRPRTDGKNEGCGRGSQSSLQHGKDKTMICSHYKRSGHDANSCFALIGYPEWWGDRPHTSEKNGGRGRRSQSSLQQTKKWQTKVVVLCGSM